VYATPSSIVTAFDRRFVDCHLEGMPISFSGCNGDPQGLCGELFLELFCVRRLVVDTGLHAKHWTGSRSSASWILVPGLSPKSSQPWQILKEIDYH
jgi:hypothetical protein